MQSRHAPWWLAREDDPGPNPLFSLRLLGLTRRAPDVLVSLAAVFLVVASRLLLLPGSIWEQDEAYFAAAVLDFDPLANHPHPPWFPLWILLGKLAHLAVDDPATALQWVSLCFSVWMLFPLTALWSRLIRRELAVAAALLFAFLPGVWLVSARAFTGTAATTLLAVACASWVAAGTRRSPIVGSIAAGACLLIRAHLAVAVVPLALTVAVRARSARGRLGVLAPLATVVTLGYGAVAVMAGGPLALVDAVREHSGIHFGQLAAFSSTFAGWGLTRALLSPWLAAAWIALALWGAAVLARQRPQRRGSIELLLCVLAPLTGLVYLLSNPNHLRYAVPLLAFSSGLVVIGTASLLRRWALAAVVVAVAASCWQVMPVASRYRDEISPPVAAVEYALRRARTGGKVVVADRTLTAFVELERGLHPFSGTVVYDHQIELRKTASPPGWATIFVFDQGHGGLLVSAELRRHFVCDQPLLRRLSQDRFLDVSVAEGAALRAGR